MNEFEKRISALRRQFRAERNQITKDAERAIGHLNTAISQATFSAKYFVESKKCNTFAVPKLHNGVSIPGATVRGSKTFGQFLCPYINSYGCRIQTFFCSSEWNLVKFWRTGYDSRFPVSKQYN